MADEQAVTFNPSEQVVVYWADMTLWQAVKYADDGDTYWTETELAVRDRFKLSTDDYWNMTVSDHARMVAYIGG